MSWLIKKSNLTHSSLIKNSSWGIFSNILQTVFVSLFFVIVARKYQPSVFAEFLISTTVYQVVAAFSSMGLGQWFIREYATEENKIDFTGRFLKTQTALGVIFYIINIALAYLVYPDGQIKLLCIILGTNIIFDNLINAIKSLNIAEFQQKKTASILVMDGFLKLLVGCLLFVQPFSAIILSILMIVVRIVTVGLFLKLGTSNSINFGLIWRVQVSLSDLKQLIIKNWQFIIIGSISIIYWRIANIIISKALTLTDVADYEIAFRIFYIVQVLPIIASATVYPQFIKYFNAGNFTALKSLYRNLFLIYSVVSFVSYAFIFSFAHLIVPLGFGNSYPGATLCLQQMFLTYLVLPTVLLQANIIVAMGLEKMDMWCNIVSLVANVAACFIGLYFLRSLTTINYSIFFSFIVFHALQDWVLLKKGITSISHVLKYYGALAVFIVGYAYVSQQANAYLVFGGFIVSLMLVSFALLFSDGSKSFINQYKSFNPKKV